MRGINKVTLLGHLGADPELRHLDTGVPVCTIRLATTETYIGKTGERIDQTEWHRVVFWRGLAETVEKYVKKGDPLYVEGSIRTRSYPDKENPAVTRYATEIVAADIRLMPRKEGAPTDQVGYSQANSQAAVQSSPASNYTNQPTPVDNSPQTQVFEADDDLPF